MKTSRFCEVLLTLLGLTALSAYVLACTSFSPDDSQVMFPAFDAKTGDIGVSLYKRPTKQTEQVFVVSRFQESGGAKRQPVYLRPQWMADGKRILVAWPGYSDNDDDVMNVALLSQDGKGPSRFFAIPGIEDARKYLTLPLAVAGHRLFLPATPDRLVRLDLETGETATNTLKAAEVVLLSNPASEAVHFFARGPEGGGGAVLGRLDPETLKATVVWKMREEVVGGNYGFALSADARRFALLEVKQDKILLSLYKGPEPDKTVTVALGEEKLNLGLPSFAPGQELIYASYASEKGVGSKVVYGLLEISLSDGSMRRHPLLQGAEEKDDGGLATFTVSVSHDGKTAALCSTYQAAESEEGLKPENCALFLVDLSRPDRQVTKIPLPFPAKKAK